MLFSALPAALIHTIAGLALLGTIAGSLQRALQDEKQRDAALIAFLITASGVTLLGVGSAFWGDYWGGPSLISSFHCHTARTAARIKSAG
jgi:benzoate membrane transport protein